MACHVTNHRRLGLVDDGTQEVPTDGFQSLGVCSGVHDPGRDALDVAPQRSPLVILVPNVWTLEDRDLVVHVPVKYGSAG